MRAFPLLRDLVTDVSWNFRVKKAIKTLQAPATGRGRRHVAHGPGRHRPVQFRKCIECFLCQGRLPSLERSRPARTVRRARFLVYAAALDASSRTWKSSRGPRQDHGIGYCNITKCCTKVCPRHITHYRQRDHPAEGAVVDRFVRPGEPVLPYAEVRKKGGFPMFELKPLSKTPFRRPSPRRAVPPR